VAIRETAPLELQCPNCLVEFFSPSRHLIRPSNRGATSTSWLSVEVDGG
jgi:hypothetical protein